MIYNRGGILTKFRSLASNQATKQAIIPCRNIYFKGVPHDPLVRFFGCSLLASQLTDKNATTTTFPSFSNLRSSASILTQHSIEQSECALAKDAEGAGSLKSSSSPSQLKWGATAGKARNESCLAAQQRATNERWATTKVK